MRVFSLCGSLWTLFVLAALPCSAADIPAPTGAEIVAPGAKLELLFTRYAKITGGLTEGPAVAPDGSIYFSDIPFGKDKGMILRFDPKTKLTTVAVPDSGKSNGLIFDSNGDLIAAEGADEGGRRISRRNLKTGKVVTLADGIGGKRFNAPNDLCIDSKGRIYFTDPRYLGHEPRELKHRAVYRIDEAGKVIEITHDVSKPNGIGLSPDGKTLYVADHDNGTDLIDPTKPAPKHGPMTLYAFPLNDKGLVAGKRKTLVDFGDEPGCDGLTVDAAGRIYLTSRSAKRPGVLVVNPQGKEVGFIPTGPANQKPAAGKSPEGLPSNVEFGLGDEINTLYITVGVSLYRIKLKAKGYHRQFAMRKAAQSKRAATTNTFANAASSSKPKLLSVKRIWDKAPHNAFTDLIRFKNEWFCVFREGKGHVSPDGALRVLVSKDGEHWESAARITSKDSDLRDAKIVVTPDGKLMLGGAGAMHDRSQYSHQSLVWFSDDGRTWSEAHPVADKNFWLWRITWHKGKAYGFGYGTSRKPKEQILRLYSSTDGKTFETLVPNAFEIGYPNEHSLLFNKDDTCYCLLRRDGKPNLGMIGKSKPPYKDWTWTTMNRRIGGPHMIRIPDGRVIAAVRLYDKPVRTSICEVNLQTGQIDELLPLPSGGDTSYAGLVWHNDQLWVSYYSSHENKKTSIYLAKVEFPKN